MINSNIGVNFQGFESSAYQNRTTPVPPRDYIDDSFQIFSKNNIAVLRIPYSWESWEYNKGDFYDDLEKISKVADAYGISCIYDNHQWECSSWLGWGIGMPNSLVSNNYEKNSENRPIRNTIKDFWNKWWNRKLRTRDNIDAWESQISFLKEIISYLRNKKSTFGFEILNEPQVYNILDYKKVGHYHNYAIRELRDSTNKPLFFNAAISNITFDNPISQSLVAPNTKENIVYDVHMYPPSSYNLMFFKFASALIRNVQIYVGEFNSGFKYQTSVSKDQLLKYLKLFRQSGIYGWALWRWYYVKDSNIPAFNLTSIANGKLVANTNFFNLTEAISEIYL